MVFENKVKSVDDAGKLMIIPISRLLGVNTDWKYKLMKAVLAILSLLPLLIYLLLLMSQSSHHKCLARPTVEGLTSCMFVNYIDFNSQWRSHFLFLGPLLNVDYTYQVSCYEPDDTLKLEPTEMYRRVHSDLLNKLDSKKDYIKENKVRGYEFGTEFIINIRNDNLVCIFENFVFTNFPLIEVMEVFIIFAIVAYYAVEVLSPSAVPQSLTAGIMIINVEVLGLAIALFMQLLLLLAVFIYNRAISNIYKSLKVDVTEA